ncbi:uncharacterized protein LOC124927405 [Impatiens glandulifera]|uniref:uncharacterized protein LOC124927405 n=1 Tax=Impatiens glandulifera TaxID=253017 RepID=UPI001FB17570|nr:uncharacterized protein LOC124927405 [Impatiens glandulifera]
MSVTATRKAKWHPAPPPPPSPKILNLPRRHHQYRRRTRTAASSSGERPVVILGSDRDYTEKLETLFDRERKFVDNSVPVAGDDERENGGGLTEEKWRFQADILRAECNFLRMEREFALKKLERNRTQMEKTLRSSVEALVLGRKKIYEGKSVNNVLEEEIEDLEEKLAELKNTSNEAKDVEVHKCSNFDKKSALLQRRLENLVTALPDNEDIISINKKPDSKFVDVESLRRKMEGLSRGGGGMVDRIDVNDIIPCSEENNKCSGRCKSILRKIVEQVRSETEQWSQMQEMVRQVRQEMEELQTSREFWEDRAHNSEFEIRSLHSLVEEWRQKAMRYETKAKEYEREVSSLRADFHKEEKAPIATATAAAATVTATTLTLGAQIAKEKLASTYNYTNSGRRNNNVGLIAAVAAAGPSRLPFRDIANSSLSPPPPKVSQKKKINKTKFPLNFPHHCTTDQSYYN